MKDFYVSHIVVRINTQDKWSREASEWYARKVFERGPGFPDPPQPRQYGSPLALSVSVMLFLGVVVFLIRVLA